LIQRVESTRCRQRHRPIWQTRFHSASTAHCDFAVADRKYRGSVKTPSASEGVFEKSESRQTHHRWVRRSRVRCNAYPVEVRVQCSFVPRSKLCSDRVEYSRGRPDSLARNTSVRHWRLPSNLGAMGWGMKAAIQTTVRSTSVSLANASWPIARAVSPTPQRYRVPAITSSG
jgi:hypothetical protein